MAQQLRALAVLRRPSVCFPALGNPVLPFGLHGHFTHVHAHIERHVHINTIKNKNKILKVRAQSLRRREDGQW